MQNIPVKPTSTKLKLYKKFSVPYHDLRNVNQVLKRRNASFSSLAKDLVKRSVYQNQLTEGKVILLIVSLRDLGFYSFGTIEEIKKAGLRLGFKLCAAEVGLFLTFSSEKLMFTKTHFVAMDALVGANGEYLIFRFNRYKSNKSMLATSSGYPATLYSPDSLFIFQEG